MISRLQNETQTIYDFLSHSSAGKAVTLASTFVYSHNEISDITRDAEIDLILFEKFNHQILKGRRKIGLWSTATNLNHISRKIADLRF